MKVNTDNRNRILDQPSYWIENINGLLYNALKEYQEKNNFNQKELANHLNISPGRLSQILNTGNINFSMEKIVEIALKIDHYPEFKLVRK